MKKYISLMVSAIAFVLNFIYFWYFDALLNRLFIFCLPPLGITLLILLAGLVLSVVSVIRHRKVIIHYISLAISLITIVVLFVFPFRTARVHVELALFEKDRYEVIEMIKNGDIASDHLGNADLPFGYGHTSSDGYVFVHQNDAEQVISFWVFRGMLSGSVKLMYSSTDESLIYENENGHRITEVQKLKDHWYLVKTDY